MYPPQRQKEFRVTSFNWRIIALQYWFHFCQTSTWISHGCTYAPSLLHPPPTSHSFQPLWVVTETEFDFPESCSKFPLAIDFTYVSVQGDFWRWRFLEKVASMLCGSDQKVYRAVCLLASGRQRASKGHPGIANCILTIFWVLEGKVFTLD